MFSDRATLLHCLQASSQIPVIFGGAYRIPSLGGYYLDGLLWMTAFVPWRAAGDSAVCRVSAFNNFGSSVGPKLTAVPPFWWILLPPSQRMLKAMVLSGYFDMEAQFSNPSDASWPQPSKAAGTGKRSPSGGSSGSNSSRSNDLPRRLDMAEVRALVREYEGVCVRAWLAFFAICALGTGAVLAMLGAFYWGCLFGDGRGEEGVALLCRVCEERRPAVVQTSPRYL